MYLEIEGAERYRAALYIRLSREDETDGPSESVSNQRAMLEDFARQRGVPVAGLYVDDGWSGTSFDRPEFRRMLRDIEAGRVNMVITKDLSRLGRDYIMTGHYMERYFPEHRVRYISLLDGIDTGVDSSANDHAVPGHYERHERKGHLQKDLQRQAGQTAKRAVYRRQAGIWLSDAPCGKEQNCGGRGGRAGGTTYFPAGAGGPELPPDRRAAQR